MRRLLLLLLMLLPALASAGDPLAVAPAPTSAPASCIASKPRGDDCLRDVFDQLEGRLNSVYQHLLREQPDAQGAINLYITIGTDGRVRALDIQPEADVRGFNSDFLDRLKKMISSVDFGPASAAGRFRHMLNFLPGDSPLTVSPSGLPVAAARSTASLGQIVIDAVSGGLSVAEVLNGVDTLRDWFGKADAFCAAHKTWDSSCETHLDLTVPAAGGTPSCRVARSSIQDATSLGLYCQVALHLQFPARSQPSHFSLLFNLPEAGADSSELSP